MLLGPDESASLLRKLSNIETQKWIEEQCMENPNKAVDPVAGSTIIFYYECREYIGKVKEIFFRGGVQKMYSVCVGGTDHIVSGWYVAIKAEDVIRHIPE